MSFEVIAEITRITARLSLILFMIAFVTDVLSVQFESRRRLWISFIAAHIVHLGFVIAYYVSLGEPPKINIILALLVVGLVAMGWLGVMAINPRQRGGGAVAPAVASWYIWSLFIGTHITRLLNPDRAGAINWLLLGFAVAAGFARFLIGIRRRG